MSHSGSNNVSLTFCAVIGLFLAALVTALLMVVGDWRFLSAAAVGLLFLILAILLLPIWFMKRGEHEVPFGGRVSGDEAGSAPSSAESSARLAAERDAKYSADAAGSGMAGTGAAGAQAGSSAGASANNAGSGAGAGTSGGGAAASSASDAAGSGAAAASSAQDGESSGSSATTSAGGASGAVAAGGAAVGASSIVKPSATLPGEAELAERKGSWTYEAPKAESGSSAGASGAGSSAAAASGSDTSSAASSSASKAAASGDVDPGEKPETLTAARGGQADDLKQIKGVGPKLEGMLHGLGFFHFDQVAKWSDREVAWVDQNLEGFKGRVSRDEWVAQAKILAAGGETEFSKKVDKGGVY